MGKVTSRRPPSIVETTPDEIKTALIEALLEDPVMSVRDWAERYGLPADDMVRLANNPRFVMGVARTCADRMARSTLPKAVHVLERALTDTDVPWSSRLDATKIVFTAARPYLEGHLQREKSEDELEQMSESQLEALVRRMERSLVDITPKTEGISVDEINKLMNS